MSDRNSTTTAHDVIDPVAAVLSSDPENPSDTSSQPQHISSDIQSLSGLPDSSQHTASTANARSEEQTQDEEKLTNDDVYKMFASPPPSDCLNDIWLSSAASADLSSPLMPRVSTSHSMLCD